MSLRGDLANALPLECLYSDKEVSFSYSGDRILDVLAPVIEEHLAHARNEAYDEAKEGIAQAIDEYSDSSTIYVYDAIASARGWSPDE